MLKAKLLSKKTILKRFFGVDELQVQFGGNPEPVMRSRVTTPEAAGILVHDPERQILIFSRQYRVGAADLKEPYITEIPAGLLDEGESAEQTAHREVAEETGYGIDNLTFIGKFFATPGYSTEQIHLYYATTHLGMRKAGGGGLAGEHEYIETVEIPVNEACKMLEDGRLCDSKTALCMLWARNRQLI